MTSQLEKSRRTVILVRYPGERIIIDDTVVRVLKIEGRRLLIAVEVSTEQTVRRPPKAEDLLDRRKKNR